MKRLLKPRPKRLLFELEKQGGLLAKFDVSKDFTLVCLFLLFTLIGCDSQKKRPAPKASNAVLPLARTAKPLPVKTQTLPEKTHFEDAKLDQNTLVHTEQNKEVKAQPALSIKPPKLTTKKLAPSSQTSPALKPVLSPKKKKTPQLTRTKPKRSKKTPLKLVSPPKHKPVPKAQKAQPQPSVKRIQDALKNAPLEKRKAAPKSVTRPTESQKKSRPRNTEVLSAEDRLKASNAFFNLVDNLIKFDVNLGGFSVGLQAERDVIPAHDDVDSYFVVDKLQIPLVFPLYQQNILNEVLPVGFFVGNRDGLEFVNIRRAPKTLRNPKELEPKIAERLEQAASSDWVPRHLVPQLSHKATAGEAGQIAFVERTQVLNQDFFKSENLDLARYGNVINVFGQAFRLPLSEEGFFNMDEEEVTSWKGYGQLEMGLEAGWSDTLSKHFANVDIRASAKIFYRGSFRFTVARDFEDKAFLRLSYIPTEYGHSEAFKATFGKFKFFDLKLFDTSVLSLPSSLFKYSTTWEQAFGKGLEYVFEYDMKTQAGREAYNQAVKGRIKESQDLARRYPKGPVKMIVKSEKEFQKTSEIRKTAISQLLKQKQSLTHESSKEKRTDAIGADTILCRSETKNHKRNKNLLGGSSRNQYDISGESLCGDTDSPSSHETQKSFKISGLFYDAQTSWVKLNAYIKAIEKLFENNVIFPDLIKPDTRVELVEKDYRQRCHGLSKDVQDCIENLKSQDSHRINPTYGKSDFRFEINLSHELLKKFALTPEDQMWPYIEEAFDIEATGWRAADFIRPILDTVFLQMTPWGRAIELINVDGYGNLNHGDDGELYLSARNFKREWLKLQGLVQEKAPIEKILEQATYAFYKGKSWTYPLVRLVLLVLRKDSIPYKVSAKTSGLPNFQTYSQAQIFEEALKTSQSREERLKNLENPSERFTQQQTSKLRDLNILQTSEDQIKLQFSADKRPKYVYLKVSDESFFLGPSKVKEIFLYNDPSLGPFQSGFNEILVPAGIPDSYDFKAQLGEHLEKGKSYSLSISLSENGKDFSPLQKFSFRLN